MSRKKSLDPDPLLDDSDKEDFGSGRAIPRKQIQDMIRKKESFSEMDLRGCDLSGLAFDGLDCSYAKFGDANLQKSTFRESNLVGASFWNANLRDCSFDGANLEEADFDYANLDGVSFRDAKIRKAIFPFKRLALDAIKASVRTGERVRMEAQPHEDED